MSFESRVEKTENETSEVNETIPHETVEYDASMTLGVNKLHIFDDVLNLW